MAKRKPAKPSRGGGARGARSRSPRLFKTVARVLAWYAIVTILFQCPSTLDKCSETTPGICKPYFKTRDIVLPHLGVYYDTYAAPHVDKARPHMDLVKIRFVAPTLSCIRRYAVDKLQQAMEFAHPHWVILGQPYVDRARHLITENFALNVSPHVERLSEAIGSYCEIAKAGAMGTYHLVILPSYELLKPYTISAYGIGYTMITKIVVPSVVCIVNKTCVFLYKNVWPYIMAFYLKNVEPELERIRKRLDRYEKIDFDKISKRNAPASQPSQEAQEPSFVKPSQYVTCSESAKEKDATTSYSNPRTPSLQLPMHRTTPTKKSPGCRHQT